MWWLILPLAVVVFLIVIMCRAASFKPITENKPQPDNISVDEQKAIEDLAEMIRCKTVSSKDEALIDKGEFEKFRNLLKERFPLVNEKCTLEKIGETGILYKLKGVSDEKPCVFMAHYDVVPANEEAWDKPAFDGVIEDGVLWGRGTLDTKGTLNGVMNAAENLLKEGFVPQNDLYFAFAGDEEIAGNTAPSIVSELEKRGVVPAMVVDEGGAVVENVFPGVTQPCALIGIAEKGMLDMQLSMKSEGGHASAPPQHTIIGQLSKAVNDVENHPFKRQLTKAVAEMFDTLGRHSTFTYRLIFANLWCFMPILDSLCIKSGGELNAMMRTTCAFTMTQGGSASNVLPPEAKMVANLRLCGTDTTDSAIEYIKNTINNPAIEVTKLHGMDPSKNSVTGDEAWEKLKNAISLTWPDTLVSPYLMVACSDSRHYCRISDHVFRFSAMALSKEERGYIHGNNERIPVDKIVSTVKFYYRLMKSC